VVQFAKSEPASRSEQDLSSAGKFNEVLLAMAAHDLWPRLGARAVEVAQAVLETHQN
jgi:hypothetical protein